jgi:hypothetical protein
MKALLRRWQTEVGETYVVSLVRLLLGVLLLLNAAREVSDLQSGPFFREVFHLPMIPENLLPSKNLFAALVMAEVVLALLVISGRAARAALFASASIGIYFLLCDRLAYHNNRYALFLFSFLIAFAPCDQRFVVGRRRPPESALGPLWAQRLAQLQIAIIYIGSGGGKLLDPDWRGGLVIGDRLRRSTQMAIDRGVPESLMRWLSDPAVVSPLSKLAIASELFLAVGLFVPRTRFFALWWGTMFHFTIEVTSKVELFGWLTISLYALFAVPTTRERVLCYDPTRAAGRAVQRLVRWLDWLARFERRAEAGACSGRRAFAVIDRDGSIGTGLRGVSLIARATPLLFPFSVPLMMAAYLTTRTETAPAIPVGESLADPRSGSEDLPK